MSSVAGDRVVDGVYHALPDPVTDRIFTVLMAVTTELWTVRDRLRLLEAALAEHGIDVAGIVESTQGTEQSLAAMRADRDAFIERAFGSLTPR